MVQTNLTFKIGEINNYILKNVKKILISKGFLQKRSDFYQKQK